MAISLTFHYTDRGRQRLAGGLASLAVALLVAVALPVSACEKGPAALIAKASAETRAVGTFTGEIVNGAPVYRLPSITVVGRLEADIAKTQRDARRSRIG